MGLLGDRSPGVAAFLIAGMYALVGMLWILFSDVFVASLATSTTQLTAIQSVKGVAFVVGSAILIYGLVYVTFRRLTVRNRRLESALRQAELLHRIARHNIRNSCNVIEGNLELLADRFEAESPERFSAVRTHNARLLTLSRKSRYLRDFLDPTTANVETLDLVPIVEEQVRAARERYPTATIATELPAEARVTVHFHLDGAIEELIENAISHNPAAEPHVWITVEATAGSVVVTVADDGPGIPPVEQRVFQNTEETPTNHSQGLGLWLVRLTVEYSEGSMAIAESAHGGAAVTLTLPAAHSAERRRSFGGSSASEAE